MPTPIEKIRDEIQARIARMSEAYFGTRREQRRSQRRTFVQNALTDTARIFILFGDREYDNWRFLATIWKAEKFLLRTPLSDNQFIAIGGTSAVYRRIAEGGLNIDERLGVWTGGFFKGLRMSGALRPCGKRQWYVWENSHRDLIRDMEGMGVFNHLERKTAKNGTRRLRRCPASFLPAEPDDGASVVAGVFAGGNIREAYDENWLEVAGTDEIKGLLGNWGILWKSGFMFRGKRSILLPPSYAPLFSNFLPPHTLERLSSIRKPALCPTLPAIYWDLVMREEGKPVIPFKNALPYSCSMRTFRRNGWKRGDLHLMGVRLGINVVEPRLQVLMRSWYESKVKSRAEGGSKDVDAMEPIITSPDIDCEPVRIGPQTEIPAAVTSS